MLIGYARVSAADQFLRLQEDALKKADCESVFTDVASGAKTARPGYIQHYRIYAKAILWLYSV